MCARRHQNKQRTAQTSASPWSQLLFHATSANLERWMKFDEFLAPVITFLTFITMKCLKSFDSHPTHFCFNAHKSRSGATDVATCLPASSAFTTRTLLLTEPTHPLAMTHSNERLNVESSSSYPSRRFCFLL